MTTKSRCRAGILMAIVVAGCSRATPDAKPDVAVAAAPSVTAAPSAAASPTAARLRVIEADADDGAASLIRTKRLEAKAEGRKLVVFVSATWCEPCKRFKAEIASGRVAVVLVQPGRSSEQGRVGQGRVGQGRGVLAEIVHVGTETRLSSAPLFDCATPLLPQLRARAGFVF